MSTNGSNVLLAALIVFLAAGCASPSGERDLTAEEREAARRLPGIRSAVHSLAGVEYSGAFFLDVTGDDVSFYLTGFDAVALKSLGGRVPLPADFSRQQNGSFAFEVMGTAEGTAGQVYVSSVKYQIESGNIRADEGGLLSVRLELVRIADVDSEGFDVPGTGGARETLTVSGRLTATCNVHLPNGDVFIDAERTANPRCAELLQGL